MPRKKVSNWGNFPVVTANVTESADVDRISDLVASRKAIIARGNGRSYGDSSLNDEIFSTLRLNKFLAFDRESGIIECEAGVLLSEILDVIVPEGFFLSVTPGTKYVTVGGAIAADVHGKNHHREGSFADSTLYLDLIIETGEIIRCTPEVNSDLFWRTCGGMGMTGIIVRAGIRLKRIETSYIRQVAIKAKDLERVMQLFEESGEFPYSVAWLDCFAGKEAVGRSILILGEHELHGRLPAKLKRDCLRRASSQGVGLPFFLPSFSLNYFTVQAFNFLYYAKQFQERKDTLEHFDRYFYPLDRIFHWNRVYGKHGFVQYQFVLPKASSYEPLVRILETIRRSGQGSPLGVLKLFGKQNSRSIMSFPMEGYTLALDFKVSPAVFRLLDTLDEIVLASGGRVYLAKDARMSSEMFHASYSRIVPSGRFRSMQSKRLKY